VCEHVKEILRIEGCELFRASINRPNLSYEVRPKKAAAADVAADIVAWVTSNYPGGESGIVYCLTRWVMYCLTRWVMYCLTRWVMYCLRGRELQC
jgi:superfamily II DNA helicase RecQ